MRRKPSRGVEVIEERQPTMTLHESVPEIAFELALYRMRFTTDSTHDILNDYMRELGA